MTQTEPTVTLTEVDAVEVLAALRTAAKVFEIAGDMVIASHYDDLHDKIQAALDAPADNTRRVNGLDRCYCGCKYWEHDRCVDCGSATPVDDCAHCGEPGPHAECDLVLLGRGERL